MRIDVLNDDLAEDLEEFNVTVTGNLVRLVGEQALVLTIVDTDSKLLDVCVCTHTPVHATTDIDYHRMRNFQQKIMFVIALRGQNFIIENLLKN